MYNLRLKDDLKGIDNPVCHSLGYRENITSLLTGITILDGTPEEFIITKSLS